ncbi:hypothetical protein ACVIWV_010082 [Bradyrhizobium diazoefficiens]|uniref:Uncharacterized protein n=1 Tax=Bradyrhizobium ottawaense TaxID=931866 RepID=A0ABV4FIA5_9BRAD|nr:hypothetical protein [Bradyrhizobium japonicum]MCP1768755.1 hypothetical protein [Bradyrhizobium japonicum]MCP1784487.1 hypothetical protein [Bradyrhizobium japonicum]MCP1794933.1 hypothetical protein [Bradyrhizobium japonicum]MCP1811545.1 hypothetical protein [Bradyrhizobium japonicum]
MNKLGLAIVYSARRKAGCRSLFECHLLKHQIRDKFAEAPVLDRELFQRTTHFIHASTRRRIPARVRPLRRLPHVLAERQFPPTMERHNAHAKRLTDRDLGAACSSQFIRLSEFQFNLLMRMFFHSD